jgi:ferritin-like metal-binding protein YciE
MSLKSVQDLLIDELRDIYHAERQLVKALPKMAKAAKSAKLRQAFEHHLEETRARSSASSGCSTSSTRARAASPVRRCKA